MHKKKNEAVRRLKHYLTTWPMLAMYLPKAYTKEQTGVSQQGVIVIVIQKQSKNGETHPISYYNQKTTKNRTKYHSYELGI